GRVDAQHRATLGLRGVERLAERVRGVDVELAVDLHDRRRLFHRVAREPRGCRPRSTPAAGVVHSRNTLPRRSHRPPRQPLRRRCLEARPYHGPSAMFGTDVWPHTSLSTTRSRKEHCNRMDSLSHRTDIELIAAHREGGDPAPREQLVMRHSGLVRSIARRYHGRGLPLEDIEQTGYVGLIQAVDRYDPSRGVPLRAYAARTIDGEIMHLFRDR